MPTVLPMRATQLLIDAVIVFLFIGGLVWGLSQVILRAVGL